MSTPDKGAVLAFAPEKPQPAIKPAIPARPGLAARVRTFFSWPWWPRTKKAPAPTAPVAETVAGADLPLTAPEARISSVDPRHILPADAIDVNIKELAREYVPGGILALFRRIGDEVDDAWREDYIPAANRVVQPAVDALHDATAARARVKLDASGANATLLTSLRQTVMSQMPKLLEVRAALKRAPRELRDIAIGVSGSPYGPAVQKRINDLWEATAVFVIAVALDLALNMGLLRSKTNREEAIAFSVAISIFGSLAALWSAQFLNGVFGYRNTVTRREEYFRLTNGNDPDTGQLAKVFDVPAQTMFGLVFSHALMFGILAGTAIYRAYISEGVGWISGTIAFTIVVLGFYAYKLLTGVSQHPRVEEYYAKKADIARLEAEAKKLEQFDGGNEATQAFQAYEAALELMRAAHQAAVSAQLAAKAVALDLIEGLREARRWFLVDEYESNVILLVNTIGRANVNETNDELMAATDEAAPTCELNLIDRLEGELATITNETGVEIQGRINTLPDAMNLVKASVREAEERAETDRREQEARLVTTTARREAPPWAPRRHRDRGRR